MRIVSVKDGVAPIASKIANAFIDFSAMTASVVAVTVADGQGREVTGYGFNSNGRYAQPGLLRERFMPRLLGGRAEERSTGATASWIPPGPGPR